LDARHSRGRARSLSERLQAQFGANIDPAAGSHASTLIPALALGAHDEGELTSWPIHFSDDRMNEITDAPSNIDTDAIRVLKVGSGPLLCAYHAAVLTRASDDEFRRSSKLRNSRDSILTSLLLFGDGTYLGPRSQLDGPSAERLLSEGVLTVCNPHFINQVAHRLIEAYAIAFRSFRTLERLRHNVDFSIDWHNYIATHRIAQGRREQRIEIAIADLDYALPIMESLMGEFLGSLPELFGPYYVNNASLFSSDASSALKTESIDLCRTTELPDLMGLRLINWTRFPTPEEALAAIAYNPSDMRTLWQLDKSVYRARAEASPRQLKAVLELAARASFRGPKFPFVHGFWRSAFELLNLLSASQISKRPLLLSDHSKQNHANAQKPAKSTSDALAVYKLYLAEATYVPRLNSIDDLLRLRSDSRLRSLRNVISEWLEAYNNDDMAIACKIRRDVALAQKDVRKLNRARRAGSIISYLSLPVSIAELFAGTQYGLGLSLVGTCLELQAKYRLEKFGWVQFGAPH
jgi:hypothetical protein